jgi:hypothetical protein
MNMNMIESFVAIKNTGENNKTQAKHACRAKLPLKKLIAVGQKEKMFKGEVKKEK